jgi:hypothetical protein
LRSSARLVSQLGDTLLTGGGYATRAPGSARSSRTVQQQPHRVCTTERNDDEERVSPARGRAGRSWRGCIASRRRGPSYGSNTARRSTSGSRSARRVAVPIRTVEHRSGSGRSRR